MARRWLALGAAAALYGAGVTAASAAVDPVADFYAGKAINMYVGTGESAGLIGAYPRTMAQVLGKYIPGHPTFIVRNMPGAGGILLANFIESIGPQDGTAWAFITRGFILAPLLGRPQAKFDPTKFQWVGSPARTVSIGLVWTTSTELRTLQDAMNHELIVGATTLAQDTGVFPTMLNQLIGTKFKIVTGYKSVPDADLAMARGELHGKVGSTWGSLISGRSEDWIATGKVKVFVQLGLSKARDIPADVPLALDFAKSTEDRQLMELVSAPSAAGYPSFLAAGVPAERVAAIRAAYVKTMNDPEYQALAKKQGFEHDPIPSDEIEAAVKRLYALPDSVKQRARQLLPGD